MRPGLAPAHFRGEADSMSAFFDEFVKGLSDPMILFGHFTYALLIASMLMRRMVSSHPDGKPRHRIADGLNCGGM